MKHPQIFKAIQSKEKPVCIICGSTECATKQNSVFSNQLAVCSRCGLVFAWPQPPLEKLRALYGESYFKSDKSHLCGYRDYAKDRGNIIKTSLGRLHGIQSVYPSKGKILDLGCAMGFFLEAAQQEGWEPYGVELSDYAASLAQQKFPGKVYHGTLAQAPFSPQSFDVITAWDYIEHVPNPVEELRNIFNLLKSDGVFVLATPDIESITAKITKDKWMGFKDTEHLYFFSRSTMRRAIRQSGLNVVKEKYIGKHIPLGFFIERLGLYNRPLSSVLEFLVPKRVSDISLYVNPGDIICVYARKPKTS